MQEEAVIPCLPEVDEHYLYRAMDFQLEASESLQEEVFFHVANLLNLEVDLNFLDTTTTYFEIAEEDTDAEEGPSFRTRSQHSKDARPDLHQVVIAFAVTRGGIPVLCWVWHGNTYDQQIIKEVKKDVNR